MGLFRKSIKHSKSSKDLDNKIKNLDEDLKRAGIIAKEGGEIFCVENIQETNNFNIVDRIDLVESEEERLYDWRKTIVEESVEDSKEDEKEILEHRNITKVEYYISESNKELILLRDQVFEEISRETLLNLPEIKNKISKVLEIYEQIQEGLLNEPPETKNNDPLTPLNQNFITVDELNKHYNLFINRIQEQIATIGGGGETKLQYLDDIVGIATNPSSYNGKFLKYNHTIGKFEFSSVGAGSQDLNDTLLLGNTSSLGMSVGIVTSTKVRVGGSTTFSEELVVTGDARVTGILTIGTGSITLDGSDDSITIGSGLTITSSGNANYSGVITATSFSGDGSNLTGIAATFTGAASTITNTQISNWNTAYSWGDHSVVGYATEGYVTNAVAGVVTFSGNYNDLSNKPTIPSDTGDLTNNVGFITAGSLVGYATEGYVDNAVVGFVTSGIVVGYATEGYVNNLVAISTFSGDYNDLTNQPTIPVNLTDLSDVNAGSPSIGQVLKWSGSEWTAAADLTGEGGAGIGLTDLSVTINPAGINSLTYNDVTGVFQFTPASFVGYATEGYVDSAVVGFVTSGIVVGYATEGYVDNLVAISTFSGDYNDLTNQPTIPSDTGDLTNSVGFVTSSIVVGYATEGYVDNAVVGFVTSGIVVGYATEGYVDNAVVGFVTSGIVVGYATEGYVDNAVAGVVTFSGNYNDLSNKPTIPSDTGDLTNNVGFITAGASGSSLTGIVTSITAGSGISIDQSTGSVTVTATGGGGSGLQSRTTVTGTTASIGVGATDNITVTAGRSYMLHKVGVSTAAWVRIYTDATNRTADASRLEVTDPDPGSGVVAEVITTGISTTALMTPGVVGFNNDTPASTNVYLAVTNKGTTTQAIDVTLHYLTLEA